LKNKCYHDTNSSMNKSLTHRYKNKGWLNSPLTFNAGSYKLLGGGEYT